MSLQVISRRPVPYPGPTGQSGNPNLAGEHCLSETCIIEPSLFNVVEKEEGFVYESVQGFHCV